MSGPVTTEDTAPVSEGGHSEGATLEITDSRQATVGSLTVRRALPRRRRRTVGAWCFVDHMGPDLVTEDRGVDIGPHPHIGLQTVTWLLAGEIVHRDSLGSEQVIRPGQLNLMTAGHGVSHSEERTGHYRGEVHGVQLWVAQPDGTREDGAGFEHHAALPQVELGTSTATVIVGDLAGVSSPARRDTEHMGVELDLRPGGVVVPMESPFEHALVVLSGDVEIEGRIVGPGHLAYLGTGRDECRLGTADGAQVMLVGGVPFDEPVLMWWNFVARTRHEMDDAFRDWSEATGRFGRVDSHLPRIEVGAPPWAG